MSFSVNDPFLYLLSAIIVVFVVAQSAFFLVKANRRAQQMGIAAATVRKTILSSALFSIAPDHPASRAHPLPSRRTAPFRSGLSHVAKLPGHISQLTPVHGQTLPVLFQTGLFHGRDLLLQQVLTTL